MHGDVRLPSDERLVSHVSQESSKIEAECHSLRGGLLVPHAEWTI